MIALQAIRRDLGLVSLLRDVADMASSCSTLQLAAVPRSRPTIKLFGDVTGPYIAAKCVGSVQTLHSTRLNSLPVEARLLACVATSDHLWVGYQ
jgi:hypothetical protein